MFTRTRTRARVARLALVGTVVATGVAVAPTASPAGAATAPVDWGNPVPGSPFVRTGDAPDGHTLRIFAGLVGDDAGLAAFAAQVTDPTSPQYGGYRPVPELAARFGLPADRRAALEQAVTAAGGTVQVDVTGAFATISVAPSGATTLFGTPFGVYEASGYQVIGPDRTPTLAPALDGSIDYVRDLDLLIAAPAPADGGAATETVPGAPGIPPVASAAVLSTPPTSPAAGGTYYRTGTATGCPEALALEQDGRPAGLAPNQLLHAYGLDALHADGITGDGVRLAVVEDAPFAHADLATFKACFGIDSPAPIEHGTAAVSNDGSETILDLEVLSFATPDAERLDVFYNPFSLDEPWTMAAFFSAPLDATTMGGELPDIVSASYGVCEPLVAAKGGTTLFPILEQVFATSAAAGVGYVVSTGDSGASACVHNGYADETAKVGYPASSAWVTAVGGTNLTLTDDNTIAGQGVWKDQQFWPGGGTPTHLEDWAGTGGTSTVIPRPSWQAGPGVPAGGFRTVPDVSYFADLLPGYLIYCTPASAPTECPSTGWVAVGGTSAATPLFAGVSALVTQQARAARQVAPGFVAPLVYRLAADTAQASPLFYDVTLGDDDIVGAGCCAAAPGYDLASGWGSLDASAMATALAPPALALSAGPVGADGSVTLTATVAAPAGSVLEYVWDTTGDGMVDAATTTPTLTTSFSGTGDRVVLAAARTSVGRYGVGDTVVRLGGASPARPVPVSPRFTG